MDYGFSLNEVRELHYDDVVASLPFEDVRCAEDPATFPDGRWPEGVVHLYADRVSSRPVECRYDGGAIEVRILAPSSPEDYRLALALVEALAAQHDASITPQDGPPLNLTEFRGHYGSEWIEGHCPTTLQAVISDCRQAGVESILAGARRDFRLGPGLLASLPEDTQSLTDAFFERFRRLQYIDRGDVFLAPAITLANDLGTRTITVSVLSEGAPTALRADIDAVILRGLDGATQQIALEALIELPAANHLRLSEDLVLVDVQEGAPWAELLGNAARHRLEDLFAVGTALDEDSREEFARTDAPPGPLPEELSALAMGPFLAFLLVAGAEGPVTREHAVRFTEALAAAVRQHEGVVGAVLSHALENFTGHLSELMRDPNLVGRIRDLAQVVDRDLTPTQSASYRMALLMLAQEVAQVPASATGERTHKAIAALAILLGLANGATAAKD